MRIKALAMIVLTATSLMAAQRSLHLAVGNADRKGKEVKVVLDAVTDTSTGELITPREAAARMAGARIIFIGESHTSIDFHRAQKRVIEELDRAGKKVMIGLEMYPFTEQKYLDDWSGGYLTEAGFLQLSHWYKNWGYNWNYYRDIFLLARDRGMRMFALNAPREVVSAVTKKGLENLTPEERAFVAPKIDTANEEHFTLFKSFFEDAGSGMHAMMTDERARAMFVSQCTWDATMGYNAVKALTEKGGPSSVMVVLIGSGHVAYNLGIQRQAAQWFDGTMASIIPIQVMDDTGKPVESVQASYADYLWGLPQERDTLYPDLGAATTEVTGEGRRRVMSVSGPARSAGFQVGDVLLTIDGAPLPDGEALNRLVSQKNWGDSATFTVRRQPKEGSPSEVTLKVDFRRTPPKK